jgi:hypothetical protein
MDLFNDPPIRQPSIAEKRVNHLDGAITFLWPSVLENAGVVKRNPTAGLDEAMPFSPVTQYTFFRVIAVHEKEINRFIPATGGVEAELFDPSYFGPSAARDRGPGSPPLSVEPTETTEVKRIYEIQCSIDSHDLAKR